MPLTSSANPNVTVGKKRRKKLIKKPKGRSIRKFIKSKKY